MRFTVLLSFFLFLAFFLLPAAFPATAADTARQKCTCAPNAFDTRWHAADAVFVGTVDDIKVIEKYVEYGNDDLPVEVTLTVDEAFKGALATKKFVLKTNLTRDTCTGHPFETAKKYLVFAYQRREDTQEMWSLYTFPSRTWDVGGLCGGTKLYADPKTEEDLKSIKKALMPAEEKRGFFDKMFN